MGRDFNPAGGLPVGTRVRQLLWAAWILSLILVVVGSLLSSTVLARIDPADRFLNDKQQHFLGYLVLAFLPPLIVRERSRAWLVSGSMLLVGIALEYLQRLTPDRQFDVADMLADALGVAAGMLASALVLLILRRRREMRRAGSSTL